MKSHHLYHFSPDGAVTEAPTLKKALSLKEKAGFIWLAYASPEKKDLDPLAEALGLHPLSIEDCFDDDYLPKIDIFPEYTGILFNDFLNADGTVTIREMNFFLGKDSLVSVFRDGSSEIHQCAKIVAELAMDTAQPALGPCAVLHAILDRVIDNKFASWKRWGQISESRIRPHRKSPVDTAKLHAIRQSLRVMRKSLFHEREILARLCRRDSPFIREGDLAYFSNLYDHLAKFVELVESNRETVTNLAQIQLSLTSNAMAESANRTNRSVNRLTLITTIFMPLSLVAGIGGMSEWTMITGTDTGRSPILS